MNNSRSTKMSNEKKEEDVVETTPSNEEVVSEKKTKKKAKKSKSSTPSTEVKGPEPGQTYAMSYDEVTDNKEEISEIRGSGRYFGVEDPDMAEPMCYNCHRRGHIRANCKVVVCHACGKIDDHYEAQCPNSKVCSNCGKKGHYRNTCTERFKRSYCTECNSRQHSQDRCPNIWRSYITLNNEKTNSGFPFNFIYCYNCASKGHYGDECNLPRTSKVPNLNGSAFAGQNLPSKFRQQYDNNLDFDDDFESDDGYSTSNGLYKGNVSFFTGNRSNDIPDGPSRKRKHESNYNNNNNYNNKRNNNGGGYNRVPPPSHLQPKKSGTLAPSRPVGPSKTGFLPYNSNHNNGYNNKRNDVYSYPRGGNNNNNNGNNNSRYSTNSGGNGSSYNRNKGGNGNRYNNNSYNRR